MAGLEKVEKFLGEYYRDDLETMSRILFFIQTEVNSFNGDTPVRNYLLKIIDHGNQELIKNYLENVSIDTKQAEKDEEYKNSCMLSTMDLSQKTGLML